MIYNLKDFEAFQPELPTLAVFGNPVGHSLSPEVHAALMQFRGAQADYLLIQPTPDEFPRAVEIARDKLIGFNCTIPFKQAVVPYLDEKDARVSFLNAANTVAIRDGKLCGYNTDGEGFHSALTRLNITLGEKRILILGCGGAALSIAYECAVSGAKTVTCAARCLEKGQMFVEKLRSTTGLDVFQAISLQTACGEFDIIINATPVGMHPQPPQSPVSMDNFTGVEFVYDCIYNPPMTQFLLDAEKKQILTDNGMSMLVLQGAAAENHWFGSPLTSEQTTQALDVVSAGFAKRRLSEVHHRSNIALTGFMGCGKTTIGKLLAKYLGMEFIDLDQKIEKETGMQISDIFEKYGEMYFRELETRACHEFNAVENTVIATGGGTVIRDQNAEILKKNCLIVFIDRTLAQIEENLKSSYARPLLQVPNVSEHIKELYDFRVPQYRDKSDIIVRFPEGVLDPARHVLNHI